jgi:hypothetical protein
MFKRSVILGLAILYLVTVSGFVLNFHYCFNRLSSLNIDAPSNACVKTLAVSKMKCCKDQHLEVKVKDSHQAGSQAFSGKFFMADLAIPALSTFSPSFQNHSGGSLFTYRGPPEPSGTPIYLTNCIFRI